MLSGDSIYLNWSERDKPIVYMNYANLIQIFGILYFSGYKTVFFPCQNNPKYLDPSFKIDLDIWDCFRREKVISEQNFIGLI